MANKYADRPYPVGKGKPPVANQFGQKGRTGGGRTPGSKNVETVVKKALKAKIAVKENGRDRKMSKQEAIVTQLVNKAASGDLKAIAIILRMNREIDAKAPPEVASVPLNEADREILEQYAKRLRGEESKP